MFASAAFARKQRAIRPRDRDEFATSKRIPIVEKRHNRSDAIRACSGTMNDDELTDAWLDGERFAGGIDHRQHVRTA